MHNLIKEDSNLESFFNYLFVEKGLSHNTVIAYETDIIAFLFWSKKYKNLKYIDLKETQVNEYITHLFKSGLKSSSVNRKISSLKALYIYLTKKIRLIFHQ